MGQILLRDFLTEMVLKGRKAACKFFSSLPHSKAIYAVISIRCYFRFKDSSGCMTSKKFKSGYLTVFNELKND
jgi:hypothetical protein